jgi:hypothetical protein
MPVQAEIWDPDATALALDRLRVPFDAQVAVLLGVFKHTAPVREQMAETVITLLQDNGGFTTSSQLALILQTAAILS